MSLPQRYRSELCFLEHMLFLSSVGRRWASGLFQEGGVKMAERK